MLGFCHYEIIFSYFNLYDVGGAVMKDYPLIKKLGLEKHVLGAHDGHRHFNIDNYINADDLERLLQNATVVYGWQESEYKSWIMDSRSNSGSTHKALLLAIEPLEQKKVTITRADLEKVVARGRREKVGADEVLDFFAKELGL